MASITQLFGDLCESHLSGFPWKAGLGIRSQSKKRTKKRLKRLAYDTLFIHLYQEETRKLRSKTNKLPVKNKMLMLSFNLRLGGMSSEADRLEELLEHVETFSGEHFTNLSAVLELLVDLAGTGPPQVLPPKRDLFKNNKYVDRKPQYQGYDYYDVSVFEADIGAYLNYQECDISNTITSTLQMMEAAPGTGLPAIGLFSQNFSSGDKFEKETRVSLFGALVHTRTTDMDIKLDLPPVPDSADLSGLAIKVPQSIDQSEDEGFQSASNMTPDSQSEPSVTSDIDLWEAVLTYGPSKRRCWERIGFPPGKREDPYLTEAGRDAFDRMYKMYEGNLQILSNTVLQSPAHVLLKESELVKDVLNVLIGVVSATFTFNQASQTFVVKQGIYVSGTSPENIGNLLAQVGDYGTYYTRLSNFSLQTSLDTSQNKGLVFQAFKSGLRKYLQYYRACVLSTPSTLSLLTISFLFRKLGRQLRYLAELCCIGAVGPGSTRGSNTSFPTGVKLLSYLYKEALENSSNENYPVLLSLLKSSCEPYTRFIYDWVYTGVLRDACKEFMIQVNEDFLGFRDKRYWTNGYVLISKDVEDCVPVFLKHLANEIYMCGKTINLLKLCCPKHYICWSDIPVPRISVTFSLEELKEIRKDCAVYIARIDRIARQSSISKEEKALQVEIAKQDLIIHARETSEQLLERFKDQQLAYRMSSDARKRELFLKLKEQYEKDQERRLAAKQEEADDDFSFARELRDREKRLKALEEELELKARQELIQHYSQLSEEATRKEQRALWKLHRHKLETARLKFFLDEEKHLQELLKQNPVGSTGQLLSETSDPASSIPFEDRIDKMLDENVSSGNMNHEEVRDESLMSLQNTVTSSREKKADSLDPPDQAVGGIHLDTPALEFADFLPVPPTEKPETQLAGDQSHIDDALQDIGSDLPKTAERKDSIDTSCVIPESEYDFNTVLKPVAFTQVSQGHIPIGDYVSLEQPRRPRWNTHGHATDANIKVGEYVPDTVVPKPQPSQHGHSSDSHINIGEYMSEVKPTRPQWNIHGHISEGHIKIGEYSSDIETSEPPRQNVHGHASDANIKIGENMSDVESSRPQCSVHGHASDANIKIGENVSDVESSRPQYSVHGHASDANIKIGGNMSDVESSRPQCSVHGHASDANIKIGENMSDVESSRPQCSVHGHASDANIKIGENVSDVESSRPRWNVHGHASDANIKIGENVSDVESSRPQCSVHGHASDANIKIGENVSDVESSRPRWNVHGHASDANIKIGENVSDVESSRPQCSVHGHASDANIKIGENVSDVESSRPRWNVHGHASDANIKIGENVFDVESSRPQCSVHGHISEGHIKIGEYASDIETSEPPRQNVHGHASDANIKIGENMSDVESSRPQCSVHGHISEGHIKIGEYASDIETSEPPRQNVHGHASDANIKIGENMSDVESSRPQCSVHGHISEGHIKIGEYASDIETSEPPRQNVHGHASDANIKIGENVSDVLSSQPRWNIHGHVSQSHIPLGDLVSDTEQSKPHCNPFGHASQSSIKIGEWSPTVQTNVFQQPKFGHSSDSTVQNVLYGEKMASTMTTTETSETEDLPSELTGSSDTVTVLSPPSVKEQSIKEVAENAPDESKPASPEPITDVQSDDKTQNTEIPCDDQPIGEDRIHDDAWQKQQFYLQTLADSYCLEKYQDTFDIMSKPPVLHMLSHVMPREFSFPDDPDIESATDETAVQLIELLSLPVLMKYSVTAPIVSSVSLVNKAVVDYYFVELNMEKHFEAIRHFLLMEDGEFAQSLSDLLFEKLVSGRALGELFTPLVLNSILNKALQYSLHGDSHLASNLSFAFKYIPEVFPPTAPDTLSCLELRYKVDWPLNIVITDTCITKYNKIFSFLLQLKHMVWTLRDVWFHLKRTALVNQASSSVQYRQLQLYRHEMQHFVKVIQGYIANQILHVTWSEFRNKLRTVSNLEEIHKTHTEYLNKALFRGLLTEKAAPLMNVIHSIFSLILKFRTQLISQSWICDKEKQVASHPNYGLMQQSYDTFKYYSDFLFEVVTKLVNRGYQPHLEDFLLRINFNSYYKEN